MAAPPARRPGHRSYVDVETIPTTNTSLVSSGSCAALVQHYTKVGRTRGWMEGIAVKGNDVRRGTAIATFVNGRYPNQKHGNHAALYVRQDSKGLWVVDQWEGLEKPGMRHLEFRGKNDDGTYVDPSNNGDAFSVIEI